MMIIDPEETQKKAEIMELELEKEMLSSRMLTSSNRFQILLETAKLLKQGDNLFTLPKVSLEAEKVFNTENSNSQKIKEKVPELETIITLKQTESLKKQYEKLKEIAKKGHEKDEIEEVKNIDEITKEISDYGIGIEKMENDYKKIGVKLEMVGKELEKQREMNDEMLEAERKIELVLKSIKEAEQENIVLKEYKVSN